MGKRKVNTKNKKEEVKNIKHPWFTLIMSTLACLALVIGLYYANKANNLKAKELKQDSKAKSSVPIKIPVEETDTKSEQVAKKTIVSETKGEQNHLDDTKKNSQERLLHNNFTNENTYDNRTDKNSKSFHQSKRSGSTSFLKEEDEKNQERIEKNQKEEIKSTTIKKNKKLTPRLSNFKKVPRLEGVKVGYEREMELEPDKMYKVITRSLRPPIFEIPNFLTGEECQQILNQVKRQVLEPSHVNEISDEDIEATSQATFNEWDYNHDHLISPLEVMHNMIDLSDLYFSEKDITKMFQDLNVDKNANGAIDLDEFLHATTDRIVRYLHKMARTLDRVKGRNSKQTWADHSVIAGLDERVAALTKLPAIVVAESEKLQVVQYDPEGHYHCHHDSQPVEKGTPCCYERDKRHCRLCRYITILYFLNDVEEGGETAFPVADNATFSIEDWIVWTKYRCDLSKHCHKANLYITPKKGTAIMWYNHHLDPKTGWVGELDEMTYHGGCDVIRGYKFIANNWINIMGESRANMITHTNPSKKI